MLIGNFSIPYHYIIKILHGNTKLKKNYCVKKPGYTKQIVSFVIYKRILPFTPVFLPLICWLRHNAYFYDIIWFDRICKGYQVFFETKNKERHTRKEKEMRRKCKWKNRVLAGLIAVALVSGVFSYVPKVQAKNNPYASVLTHL